MLKKPTPERPGGLYQVRCSGPYTFVRDGRYEITPEHPPLRLADASGLSTVTATQRVTVDNRDIELGSHDGAPFVFTLRCLGEESKGKKKLNKGEEEGILGVDNVYNANSIGMHGL